VASRRSKRVGDWEHFVDMRNVVAVFEVERKKKNGASGEGITPIKLHRFFLPYVTCRYRHTTVRSMPRILISNEHCVNFSLKNKTGEKHCRLPIADCQLPIAAASTLCVTSAYSVPLRVFIGR